MNTISTTGQFPKSAPKGSKCYLFMEEKVYEQISLNPKEPRWIAISSNTFTLQFLVNFLMNPQENPADLTGSLIEPTTTTGGQSSLLVSNMI